MLGAAEKNAHIIEIDALSAATTAGSSRAVNMVMIGALSKFMSIPTEVWESAIREVFEEKAKLIPMNLQAFQLGRDLAE